jgi:hypothetical protein
MSILLSRMCVVPTWFVVMDWWRCRRRRLSLRASFFLGAVVAASAVIITFVLRRGLNGAGAMDIQRMWHRERDDRAALGLDGDAQDLMRMDSDKG